MSGYTAEVGWLVERRPAGALPFLALTPTGAEWTANHAAALRFARKADAEAYIANHVDGADGVRPMEHRWLIPASPERRPHFPPVTSGEAVQHVVTACPDCPGPDSLVDGLPCQTCNGSGLVTP